MIAPLARFLDWSALQMASVVAPVRDVPESKWRLAEALEFLNGPDFVPTTSDPARIEFDGRRNFRFPSPRPSEDAENNIVYGRLYRCAERWRERPVIILLDGAPSLGYHTVLPWIARWLNRQDSMRPCSSLPTSLNAVRADLVKRLVLSSRTQWHSTSPRFAR